jgi:hypothetical protein
MIPKRDIRSLLYRFRSRSRYDSLTFKQYENSFHVLPGKHRRATLVLAKLGHVKMVMHRPIKGCPRPPSSNAPRQANGL